MNTRFALLARSSLVMTGITLALASACGSDSSTQVDGASGSGGGGGSPAGHGGASGSSAQGGASGHGGSLAANAGESAGGAAGELGLAGTSAGGTSAGAGGAFETSSAGGEAGTAEAGAAGAATVPMCSSSTECDSSAACVASTCVPVAAALTGLRWQLPCTAAHGSVNCACPATDLHTAQLTGQASASYNVTLHFRGIVEQKTYSGGTTGLASGSSNSNLFISGGAPASDTWNIYRLDVSSPAQTFYLNAGASGTDQVWWIDYRATVVMAAGATVTLKADSVESVETFNRNASGTAVVVPGVPPAPDSYDGQFVQVDVESVSAI